jgi:putative addiction module killer protein
MRLVRASRAGRRQRTAPPDRASELRVDYGPGYRVYYKQTGKDIMLLSFRGDKSTQDGDIRRAKQLAAEL